MLAVGEVIGEKQALQAASQIGFIEDEGLEVLLLSDLHDLFDGKGAFESCVLVNFMSTESVVSNLTGMKERVWSRVRRNKPMDGAWLARKLKGLRRQAGPGTG
jgi:hypothetical protein